MKNLKDLIHFNLLMIILLKTLSNNINKYNSNFNNNNNNLTWIIQKIFQINSNLILLLIKYNTNNKINNNSKINKKI